MTVFGRMVTGAQVEQAALATLRTWIPDYLRELERQVGRIPGALPLPRSWAIADRPDRWPEEQLPAVVLVSPGWTEPPRRNGRGVYSAWWTLSALVYVAGPTRESTNELSKLYAAALRELLVEKSSLGGFADAFELLGESYDEELYGEFRRTVGVGYVIARFHVEGVAGGGYGPTNPTPDPVATTPGDWPVVPDRDHVHIDVTKGATA